MNRMCVDTKEQLHMRTLNNNYICIQVTKSYPSLSTDPWTGSNLGSLPTYGKERYQKHYMNLEDKAHDTTSKNRLMSTHLHERN